MAPPQKGVGKKGLIFNIQSSKFQVSPLKNGIFDKYPAPGIGSRIIEFQV